MIRLKHLLTEAAPLSADNTFRKKVKEWEGPGPVDANNNHLAYDDKNPGVAVKPGVLIRGKLTIGYGTTDTVLPTLKAGMKISPSYAETLLTLGINQHEADARRLIPKYDSYPTYVREAILNARYRGDLGPDTIKLINAGKWSKVSAEYLKHKNYTNPGSLSGVVARMKANAIAFDTYAAKIKSKKTTSAVTSNGMIGKVLYPRKTSTYNYATVRTSPEVNTGFINNEQVKIVWPNPIGIVDGEKMVGSNTWYRVRLPKGIGNGTGIGWVRFDVVTTDKNAKYN
jgi:GH24 family phage-related lysozyme (muramidase)